MAVKKSRKFTCFVIFFLSKIVHLKQLKWMQCSKLGSVKRVPLLNGKYAKGYRFGQKCYVKGLFLFRRGKEG